MSISISFFVLSRYKHKALKTAGTAAVLGNVKALVKTPQFKEFCDSCEDKQLLVEIVAAIAK